MLKLKDCGLSLYEKESTDTFLALGIELPERVNFSKVAFISNPGCPDYVNNTQGGHARFPGRLGEVYIACDTAVRFHPKNTEYLNRVTRDFKSGEGWNAANFSGKSFCFGYAFERGRCEGVLGKGDIVKLIEGDFCIGGFLKDFLGWVEEYRKYPGFYGARDEGVIV